MSEVPVPVCDYEGYAYHAQFWGHGREYEDTVERVALRAMLPPEGRRLIEVGAGYGRLAPLYAGYDEVVLFDYALSLLRRAREIYGEAGPNGRPCYRYVAGDFYRLPFAPALFDVVVMVRTLHHAVDAPSVLRGVAEILAPGGTFVLEFANKHNLKAILRYLVHRQAWSPFDLQPVEFTELHFDFHPCWIRQKLAEAGLRVKRQRTVSHFRLGWLKRRVPLPVLVWFDRCLQPTGSVFQLSPSVFVQSVKPGQGAVMAEKIKFRCTVCGSLRLVEEEEGVSCQSCGVRFAVRDGIYDFKNPIEVSYL